MSEWEYRIMLDGSDDGPHRALNDGSMSEEEYRLLRANSKNPNRGIWIEKRLKAGKWEKLQ
jgi:hypothetical protein